MLGAPTLFPRLHVFSCMSDYALLAVHASSICSPHTLGGQYDIFAIVPFQ